MIDVTNLKTGKKAKVLLMRGRFLFDGRSYSGDHYVIFSPTVSDVVRYAGAYTLSPVYVSVTNDDRWSQIGV